MSTLTDLLSTEQLSADVKAIETKTTKKNEKVNNKTALGSLILCTQNLTQSASVDLALITALANATQVTVSQVHALCAVYDERASYVHTRKHIVTKITKHNLQLTIDKHDVISCNDVRYQRFITNVFNSDEYKNQLVAHATALFTLIDEREQDAQSAYKQAHELIKAEKAAVKKAEKAAVKKAV